MARLLTLKLLILFIVILVLSAYIFTEFPLPTPSTTAGKVKYPQDYTIVMVGDSMTETLGNSDELKKFLADYYPGKTFEVLNYGFGATNILSVMDRLTKETEHGRKFRPILDIDYDLILIESFGQNPLSEHKPDEGLRIQREELNKIVSILKEQQLRGKIVFVASISPNKEIFAKNQVDLSHEKRAQWVKERISYIKNHIEYGKAKFIPVINIFEKSLLEQGDGNPDYISTDDYIHPSPTGIIFISQEIASFIYNNSIFPH